MRAVYGMSELYVGNLHPLGEDASLHLLVGLQVIPPVTIRRVVRSLWLTLGSRLWPLKNFRLAASSLFMKGHVECFFPLCLYQITWLCK